MEDLEQRIAAVLQDPEQMQQIMELAKSMGLSMPEASADQDRKEPPGMQEEGKTASSPDFLSPPIAQLLTQAGKLNQQQENLLNALKPFLKPVRREKIDRAMQVARFSHLAGYALRRYEQKEK